MKLEAMEELHKKWVSYIGEAINAFIVFVFWRMGIAGSLTPHTMNFKPNRGEKDIYFKMILYIDPKAESTEDIVTNTEK